MIFLTVGSQMPFDRLVRAVDTWAGEHARADVFGQIGTAEYLPCNFPYVSVLSTAEYSRRVEQATIIISHAGMGTILTALEHGKPLLVMPRLGSLDETRNDHQIATAREFASQGMVHAARDEQELAAQLERIDDLTSQKRIGSVASNELITAIRNFILGDVHALH